MTTSKSELGAIWDLAGAFAGWRALAVIMLLTASCGSVGPTPKPDPNMTNRQEEAQRDRGRTREETAVLVRDIEDLNKQTDAAWSEYAKLKGDAAAAVARHGGASPSIQASFRKMTMDGIRRKLESASDDLLPSVGQQVAGEYRLAKREHRKAVVALEAAKTNQQ